MRVPLIRNAVQIAIALTGRLDQHRFRDAVHVVLTRHPHLGAGLITTGLDEPVQVILKSGAAVAVYRPCRSGADPEDRIAWVCAQERGAVYDLVHQSPLRVVLFRIAPERYRLVLTNHHIVLDGWSLPILLREIFAGYSGQPLPTPASYRGFLAWLAGQDVAAAETAWRTAFAGFDGPTLVGPPDRVGRAERGVASFAVRPTPRRHLTGWRARINATLDAVLQAALGAGGGRADRPTRCRVRDHGIWRGPGELAGVESMVGPAHQHGAGARDHHRDHRHCAAARSTANRAHRHPRAPAPCAR